MVPHALTVEGVQGGGHFLDSFDLPWLGRGFSRGASGVSWHGGQCGWMAWDGDHLAQGFRHSSEERVAGEAWASFKTLATEDAGIPNRRAVSRRPTPWAFN